MSSWTYPGFAAPTYTQIPDEFFDEVMSHLTDAELRVILYIMRRTFGFKKPSDAISYTQFLRGIKTRDGRQLDEGCGLAGTTNLSRALKGLEEKGLIVAHRGQSTKGDHQTTIYALRFRLQTGVLTEREYPPAGVLTEREYPTDQGSVPVLIEREQQETVLQQTENNRTDSSRDPVENSALAGRIDELSKTYRDTALASNRTRIHRLMTEFGQDEGIMLFYLERAVRRVDRAQDLEAPMAYFFTVLEGMLMAVPSHRRATG